MINADQDLIDKWVNNVMVQAQVFASAWALVGTRFDQGNATINAEIARNELRTIVLNPPEKAE